MMNYNYIVTIGNEINDECETYEEALESYQWNVDFWRSDEHAPEMMICAVIKRSDSE